MSKEILFSVVVTLYNKENYIRDTMMSVCQQTYKNFEIIVVNDGSTDQSLKEVLAINDDRIKLFSITNKGVSHARNFGVKKAKGSHIAFIDGDDLWKINHLGNAVSMIEKYPKEFVFSSATLLKNHKKIKERNYAVENQKIQRLDYFKASLKQSILHPSSLIIEKNIYTEIGGFDIKYSNYEDVDFWFKIGLRYKIVFSIQDTVVIRLTENSLSRSKIDLSKCCFLEDYDDLKNNNKAFNEVLHQNKYSLALLCKENKDRQNYKEVLARIDRNKLSFRQKMILTTPLFLINILKKILF